MKKYMAFILVSIVLIGCQQEKKVRTKELFTQSWKFHLGDTIQNAGQPDFNDSSWRMLNLPHDWSIEGSFSKDNSSTTAGGALPTGIGWYRKSFKLPESVKGKNVFIDFDGVYRNSEVWINGHKLGKRTNGYISFRYDLTSFLRFGDEPNIIVVKVDNSAQPNSRWYTGSGIYRNVWLVTTGKVYVKHWGAAVRCFDFSKEKAEMKMTISLVSSGKLDQNIRVETRILDENKQEVARVQEDHLTSDDRDLVQTFMIKNSGLWSVDHPVLYKAVINVYVGQQQTDTYETSFGIRDFKFDAQKGFFLNGK